MSITFGEYDHVQNALRLSSCMHFRFSVIAGNFTGNRFLMYVLYCCDIAQGVLKVMKIRHIKGYFCFWETPKSNLGPNRGSTVRVQTLVSLLQKISLPKRVVYTWLQSCLLYCS
jgi:hypothetical protein